MKSGASKAEKSHGSHQKTSCKPRERGEGKVGLATAGSQTVYDRFLIFDMKKDLKTKNYNPISEVSLIYIKTI